MVVKFTIMNCYAQTRRVFIMTLFTIGEGKKLLTQSHRVAGLGQQHPLSQNEAGSPPGRDGPRRVRGGGVSETGGENLETEFSLLLKAPKPHKNFFFLYSTDM